jgi:DNA polymerase delta subunit 1
LRILEDKLTKRIKVPSCLKFLHSSETLDHPVAEGGAGAWARPQLNQINEETDSISAFNYVKNILIGNRLPVFQQIEVEQQANANHGRSAVRIYGVTEAGHSVLMHANGFMPYFFIPAPRGFQESDIEPFEQYLKGALETAYVKVELVKKRPLMGYRGDDWPVFIRVAVNEPKSIPKTRNK